MGGGGFVGGLGGLVGIESKEEKAANRAADASIRAQTSNLQFQKDIREENKGYAKDIRDYNQGILDDWESMFGGIENNLSEYYNNLDPTKFATTAKTNLYSNIDKQLGQLQETLSAQGIYTGGMRVQAEKEAAFAKATGAAQIDINAPEVVNQMQQGWLNRGESRRANAEANITNSYSSLMGSNLQSGQAVSNAYAGIAEAESYKAGMNEYRASSWRNFSQEAFKESAQGAAKIGASFLSGGVLPAV